MIDYFFSCSGCSCWLCSVSGFFRYVCGGSRNVHLLVVGSCCSFSSFSNQMWFCGDLEVD